MNISLTTYNRFEYFLQSFESLASCNYEDDTIYIYDDKSDRSSGVPQTLENISSSISDDFIQGLSLRINLSQTHLGCDLRVYNSIKETFEQTEDKFIMVLDSDGIYNRDCFSFMKSKIKELEQEKVAAISVYNSKNLPVTNDFDQDLSEKSALGGFAIALNREIFDRVDPNVTLPAHNSFSWDWQFSTIAKDANYKLLCTKKSYAQHIGKIGEHCNPSSIDEADDFIGR